MPRHASFVGRFEDSYIWVMPDGVDGLSELSLAIMDIATREDASSPADNDRGSRLTTPPLPAGVPRRQLSGAAHGADLHARRRAELHDRSSGGEGAGAVRRARPLFFAYRLCRCFTSVARAAKGLALDSTTSATGRWVAVRPDCCW